MKNKIIVFIALSIIIFLIILIAYFIMLRRNNGNVQQPIFPFIPTPSVHYIPPFITSPTPTLIPPAFTGASEETEISQEDLDLSTQKYNLRKKTPLKQNQFSIYFDYSTDKFNVILSEPKDVSQEAFISWLSNNYPAVPLDRFVIK